MCLDMEVCGAGARFFAFVIVTLLCVVGVKRIGLSAVGGLYCME